MLRFSEWRVINTYARMFVFADVMEEIYHQRGNSGAQIARQAQLGKNAVSNALIDMEEIGWIARDTPRKGGYKIEITMRGKQVLTYWRAHQIQREDAA